MAQATGIAIVVLLVIIAVELLLIHRDILYLTAFRRGGESEGVGQTINVNVGPKDERTADTAAAGTPTAAEPLRTAEAETESGDDYADEEGREPVRIEPRPAARIATSSGLVAKRCPACGMENSSMRNECFNCGSSL